MTSRETRTQREDRGVGHASRPGGGSSDSGPVVSDAAVQLRLAELEMENLRLHRLVTELLMKNQELRKQLCQ
jgi:hypothetical protein